MKEEFKNREEAIKWLKNYLSNFNNSKLDKNLP